jgi:hypothetical protein
VPEKPKASLVKTSIYVPDDLHDELRLYVAKQARGTSLNDVMVKACRAYLKAERSAAKVQRVQKVPPAPANGGPIT